MFDFIERSRKDNDRVMQSQVLHQLLRVTRKSSPIKECCDVILIVLSSCAFPWLMPAIGCKQLIDKQHLKKTSTEGAVFGVRIAVNDA